VATTRDGTKVTREGVLFSVTNPVMESQKIKWTRQTMAVTIGKTIYMMQFDPKTNNVTNVERNEQRIEDKKARELIIEGIRMEVVNLTGNTI
jgi:hypothetical protein